MGLVDDDLQIKNIFKEASDVMLGYQLRQFFAWFLLSENINGNNIWNEFNPLKYGGNPDYHLKAIAGYDGQNGTHLDFYFGLTIRKYIIKNLFSPIFSSLGDDLRLLT
jgi:hypothetical protein